MQNQPNGRKYHAFISYSHAADGDLAPAVQTALERFGQPWYSRARVQVFRDQTDLALTPDLPREIQRALERSGFLILLAGPAGARSPWVEQEVRFWLQHRSASRILIVRTGGELQWGTDDFDWNRTTALPPCLKQVFDSEPLWADLSWVKAAGDRSLRNPRFQVEIAKLVAGIHGETLTDTLNRAARQHQRAMRWLWATIVGLAGLALAALGAASLGFQAKRTADKAAAAIQAELDQAQHVLEAEAEARRVEQEQRAADAASARWAAKALSILSEDREASLLLALEAVNIAPTREAEQALRRSLLEPVPPLRLPGDPGAVYETQFSADGKRVLTSSADGTVRLWDAATGTNTLALQVIAEANSGDRASGMLSRDGTRVLTLARPETLEVGHWESPAEPRLYDAATGDLLARISDRFVVSAALSPDHARIATAGFNTAAGIWDARTGRLEFSLAGHEQRLASAEFSAHGDSVATASWDGTARVWDVRTGRNVAVLRTSNRERVDFAGFSPDGTRVTTLCDDGKYISLWDWRSRSGVPVATLTGHTGAIRDFAVSADGAWLVTASTDQTARIWDTTTGQCLRILAGHEGFVNGVAISPNDRWVITAGSDTTARVWDAATGENWMELGGNTVPRTSVAFSPDGKRIITGTVEGGVPLYTYDILGTVEELRTLAQARVQRRLTAEERLKYFPDASAE